MLSDCGHKCARKYLVDGIFYCGKCFNKLHPNAWYCDGCKEYHDLPIYRRLELNYSTLYMCQFSSFCGNYAVCSDCRNKFTLNFAKQHPFRRNRPWKCPECACTYYENAKTKVNDYYFEPTMLYFDGNHSSADGNNFKGCGIELEVDNGGEVDSMSDKVVTELNNEVYCKHDGSLSNGFEIVTYPHTLDSILDMNWEETFKNLICSGYRSHDPNTCGLHMHFSRSLFTKDEILYLLYFIDKYWDDWLKFSRRDSNHASRWANRYFPSGSFTLQDVTRVYNQYNLSGCHSFRYHALNLIKGSTIEFRLMRGTLNYNTFRATVNFLCTVVKNSANITPDNINDLSVWLKGLEENTISYMKRRHCFGYSNDGRVPKEGDLCL